MKGFDRISFHTSFHTLYFTVNFTVNTIFISHTRTQTHMTTPACAPSPSRARGKVFVAAGFDGVRPIAWYCMLNQLLIPFPRRADCWWSLWRDQVDDYRWLWWNWWCLWRQWRQRHENARIHVEVVVAVEGYGDQSIGNAEVLPHLSKIRSARTISVYKIR